MKKNIKQLSKMEIAGFCEQMSMIIKAGITPKDGLELMLSDSNDKASKEVIESLLETSRQGETFSTCVRNSGYFPEYVIRMIQLGEETGTLDDVLDSLNHYYEHEEIISDNIRSAISYPIVMVVMMMFIIIILVSKVLPLFNQVFTMLGAEMDGIGSKLLSIGESIQSYSFGITIGLFAILILILLIMRTKPGKKIWTAFLVSFPATRGFQRDIAYGRFARGMALALSSGIRIYTAIDLVDEIIENDFVRNQVENLKTYIIDGMTFAEALKASGIFSNLYSRMVYIGVKSGNTDVVLDKIAGLYEEDTDRRLANFISVIEPTLVISLSVVVGLILLSVILPLLGVMSGLG